MRSTRDKAPGLSPSGMSGLKMDGLVIGFEPFEINHGGCVEVLGNRHERFESAQNVGNIARCDLLVLLRRDFHLS